MACAAPHPAPPLHNIKTQGPCSLLAAPRSERIIVSSNVRPAMLPVGRLVEQVWGRDGGRKLLIITTRPALLQALRRVFVCLRRCGVGDANPGALPWRGEQPGDQRQLPGACVSGGGHEEQSASLSRGTVWPPCLPSIQIRRDLPPSRGGRKELTVYLQKASHCAPGFILTTTTWGGIVIITS